MAVLLMSLSCLQARNYIWLCDTMFAPLTVILKFEELKKLLPEVMSTERKVKHFGVVCMSVASNDATAQ